MILTSKDTLSNIFSGTQITVYHASSQKQLLVDNSKGLHVGSLEQALDRADFYVNDECLYTSYYIHELEIRLPGRDKVGEILDDGYRADTGKENILALTSDILVYRNVAEGKTNELNLSLIILNADNIESCNIFSVYNRAN